MTNSERLDEAKILARSGEKDAARQILEQILREDPQNESAWMWLVDTLPDNAQQVAALEQCLKAIPHSVLAQKALAMLYSRSQATPPPAAPPSLLQRVSQVETRPEPMTLEEFAASVPLTPPPAPEQTVESVPVPAEEPVKPRKPAPSRRRRIRRWLVVLSVITLLMLAGLAWFAAGRPGLDAVRRLGQPPVVNAPAARPTQLPTAGIPVAAATPAASADSTLALEFGPAVEPLNELPPGFPTTLGRGKVEAFAIAPDGNSVALALTGGISVRGTPALGEKQFIGTDDLILALAYEPGGSLIAASVRTNTPAGQMLLWQADGELQPLGSLSGAPADAVLVTFSSDASLLAAVDRNKPGQVLLWHRTRGGDPLILPVSEGTVTALAFSPETSLLAAGNSSGSVNIWDTAGGSQLRTFTAEAGALPGQVNALAFSPDRASLAVGTADSAVRLWDVLSGTQQARFNPNRPPVGIAFSPDGMQLAISSGQQVTLWNLADNTPQSQLDETLPWLAFSPDGSSLIAAGPDRVHLWLPASREMPGTVDGLMDAPVSLSASADDRWLAACANNQVFLWDLTAGEDAPRIFNTRFTSIASCALSPDGSMLAVGLRKGDGSGAVDLWQVSSGTLLNELSSENNGILTQAVIRLQFSPDGSMLAAGTARGVEVWRTTNGTLQNFLPLQTWQEQLNLAFADKHTLAVALQHAVVLWNLENSKNPIEQLGGASQALQVTPRGKDWQMLSASGQQVFFGYQPGNEQTAMLESQSGRPLRPLAFSPNRRILAGGDGNCIAFWSLPDGREIMCVNGFKREVNAAIFLKNGQVLAAASTDGTLRLLTTPDAPESGSAELITSLSAQMRPITLENAAHLPQVALVESTPFISAAVAPDGGLAAAADAQGKLSVWNLNLDQPPVTAESAGINRLQFAGDGHTLAVGHTDGSIDLWNALTMEKTAVQVTSGKAVTGLAFHPGGGLLATVSSDAVLNMWNILDRQPFKTLDSLPGATTLARSADGQILAAGFENGQVRLWGFETGRDLATLNVSAPVSGLAFSPDGKTLAVASGQPDGHIQLFDTASHNLLYTFMDQGGQIGTLAFSPNGSLLASGSDQLTLCVWDVAGQKLLHTYTGYEGTPLVTTFSANGRLLITASADGKIQVLGQGEN